MKPHLRFSAYSVASHPRIFRDVLESSEGSLKLFDPERKDTIATGLVRLGLIITGLVVYARIVELSSTLVPYYAVSIFGFVVWLIFTIGFFASLYYSAKFSDYLGAGIEVRLTARHPNRTFLVHVRHVKPTTSRTIQLLRLVGDGKDEWFRVNVSGPDLAKALRLAKEEIKIVLDE